MSLACKWLGTKYKVLVLCRRRSDVQLKHVYRAGRSSLSSVSYARITWDRDVFRASLWMHMWACQRCFKTERFRVISIHVRSSSSAACRGNQGEVGGTLRDVKVILRTRWLSEKHPGIKKWSGGVGRGWRGGRCGLVNRGLHSDQHTLCIWAVSL